MVASLWRVGMELDESACKTSGQNNARATVSRHASVVICIPLRCICDREKDVSPDVLFQSRHGSLALFPCRASMLRASVLSRQCVGFARLQRNDIADSAPLRTLVESFRREQIEERTAGRFVRGRTIHIDAPAAENKI